MLCESRWSLKVNNNVGDLVKTCPLSNNIFIKIWVTQLDIHTVAPLGIFIRGLMWPISKWWVHIYYHWYLFYVPRGCTPKGHFFKKFNKRIGVNLLQRWPPNAIENRKWPKTFSVEMEDYLGSKGIHPAKSATYWRRSNIEKERYNQTLLKSIGAIHAKNKDWQPYLTQCFSIFVQQNMLQCKAHVWCFFLIETFDIITTQN